MAPRAIDPRGLHSILLLQLLVVSSLIHKEVACCTVNSTGGEPMNFIALLFALMFAATAWLILDYMFGDRVVIELMRDIKRWWAWLQKQAGKIKP